MTTLAPLAPAAAKAAGKKLRRRRRLAPYGFLAPALVLFALFMALPILYSVYLSLRTTKVSGLGLGKGARTEVWAGLENYSRSLSDPEFIGSVVRVGLYGLVLVPTMIGMALLFALLLDSRRTRAKKFSRVSMFLPFAVPAVIASLLWGFLYLPRVSPFDWLAGQLGVPFPDLMSSQYVTFAIANIALWGGVGFNMIVIYTALKAVPNELYEAARLDGASEIAIAWRIKIPMISPSLVLTFLFTMIATLQVFAEPVTLRPLTNTISWTWSPLMKVYRDAFIRNDIYAAAATSIVIAALTFCFSFLFLRMVQGRAFSQENN